MQAKGRSLRFHQLLELQLNNTIKKFIKKPLTPELMREIRETFRGQIEGVFAKSTFQLSKHAVTWLTDQYFKNIQISEDQMMSDTVVINEYKLPELQFNDILLLRNLFNETIMGPELEAELKRRSAS